jgi:hypothetical protein
MSEEDDDEYTGPDNHATPEEQFWLDKAVAILNTVPEDEAIPEDRKGEWQEIIKGLCVETGKKGLYGCEYIHRGWNLELHGMKLLTCRWTPEERAARIESWKKALGDHYPEFCEKYGDPEK